MVQRQHEIGSAHAFMQPGSLTRHLQTYLEHLLHRGYSPLTIRGYSESICHFSQWLDMQKLTMENLDDRVLRRFAEHRCRCPGGRQHLWISRKYAERVNRFVGYLRRLGTIAAASSAHLMVPDLADEFIQWPLAATQLPPGWPG